MLAPCRLFRWDHELGVLKGDADQTLQAFTHWLWSGNGFSKERYAKLGLERPQPPPGVLAAVQAGARQGIESLRGEEDGAITNPEWRRIAETQT